MFVSSFSLRYPMVTYCHESPKLCVGTRTGVLALYDLKTSKYQVERFLFVVHRTIVSFPSAIPSASEKRHDHLRGIFTRWKISRIVFGLRRLSVLLAGRMSHSQKDAPNRLLSFQTASNTFFSSSSSINLVSRQAAQRLERSIPSPMKKVDMNWLDRTTVRMFWHVDRSEKKFTI